MRNSAALPPMSRAATPAPAAARLRNDRTMSTHAADVPPWTRQTHAVAKAPISSAPLPAPRALGALYRLRTATPRVASDKGSSAIHSIDTPSDNLNPQNDSIAGN